MFTVNKTQISIHKQIWAIDIIILFLLCIILIIRICYFASFFVCEFELFNFFFEPAIVYFADIGWINIAVFLLVHTVVQWPIKLSLLQILVGIIRLCLFNQWLLCFDNRFSFKYLLFYHGRFENYFVNFFNIF